MPDQRAQASHHTLKGHAAPLCSVSQGVKDKSYNLMFPGRFTFRAFLKTLQAVLPGTERKYGVDRNPNGSNAQSNSRPGPEVPDGRSSLRGSARDLVPFDPSPGSGTRPSGSADIPAARAARTCKSWGLPPPGVSMQPHPSCLAASLSPHIPPDVLLPLRLHGAGRQPDNARPREHGGALKVGQTGLTARARRSGRPGPLRPRPRSR